MDGRDGRGMCGTAEPDEYHRPQFVSTSVVSQRALLTNVRCLVRSKQMVILLPSILDQEIAVRIIAQALPAGLISSSETSVDRA